MNDLLNLDKRNIWHPFTPLEGATDPILISSAEGVYLNTHDGRKIIDAISSWWVNIHGHSNPYIAKAVADQALTLEHVIFAGFTHEPAITLGKNLLSILPSNQSKIFFSDNGSTAVEVAIKMAIQYWHNQGHSRKRIIALEGAYHGDTFGAMSVGARGLFTNPFSNHLFKVDFIEFPNQENHEQVLNSFKAQIKKGDVAAFIFEPLVQGASGMRMYSPVVLDEMIQLALEHEVLCIADEVFTGFGRTGKLFATDFLKNKPDIFALSKGLTGGTLPLGVTACSEKITQAFKTNSFEKTFFHGHSFTANPLSCAAANASFDLLMRNDCTSAIETISNSHRQYVKSKANNAKIKRIELTGTILRVELNAGEHSSYTNKVREKIYPFFLERNILLRPLGNTLYVVPPYVITSAQLSSIYLAIDEFLESAI